jgi:hypothetical protein
MLDKKDMKKFENLIEKEYEENFWNRNISAQVLIKILYDNS